MCGGFTCSKQTLIGLNVIYILVSFLMIGVAVHGKVSGIVTSLPIIGGITACGIFLLLISVVGLIGAVRHHQVMLFFYMVILFLIFLIQFSVSCAALAINESDEKKIISQAWNGAVNHENLKSLVVQAERSFDCCGLGLDDNMNYVKKPTKEEMEFSINNTVFTGRWENNKCAHVNGSTDSVPTDCYTCFTHINEKVNGAFNSAGGLGLFFSFVELVGGIVACRYRNQLDPLGAGGLAGSPFSGSA